jgi:hypothetical protein
VLLVVEVKTSLNSIEETLRHHDAKVRLAAREGRERFGWEPVRVSRLLVLPDTSTARRRVDRVKDVLDHPYPLRGREATAWLRQPEAASTGMLMFLSPTPRGRHERGPLAVRRMRVPKTGSGGPTDAAGA